MTDATYVEIKDRLKDIEVDMGALSQRVEATREMVTANQIEFKERIKEVENTAQEGLVSLTALRSEHRTGTGLLAFLIIAGISLLAAYRG
jgi:hypothetical protein